MGRYVISEDRLQAKVDALREQEARKAERLELRKRRELLRRRIHAALYAPRLCMGDPDTGQACEREAIPGTTMCARHGGTTKAMQAAAKMRLLYLVEPALRVLSKSLASGDENIRLKAALALLDRAGFHPHATLEISDPAAQDLSSLSNDQLKRRAARLIQAMEDSADQELEELAADDPNVIDVTSKTVN